MLPTVQNATDTCASFFSMGIVNDGDDDEEEKEYDRGCNGEHVSTTWNNPLLHLMTAYGLENSLRPWRNRRLQRSMPPARGLDGDY